MSGVETSTSLEGAVERRVCAERELKDGSGRVLFKLGEREVGVFLVDGEIYAYESRCPHQGGPVCRGSVIHQIRGVLDEDRALVEEQYVKSRANLVCPWHGFEFDVRTGRCVADARYRLRSFEVTVRDGDVYVTV